MTNTFVSVIGMIAAFCTTIAQLPQVLKVLRTNQTRDISLWMYIIINVGILLWLVYGIYIVDYPLILANAVTLILTMIVLIMKIKLG
jgi:MtN3 and saliva related transmembrane protein